MNNNEYDNNDVNKGESLIDEENHTEQESVEESSLQDKKVTNSSEDIQEVDNTEEDENHTEQESVEESSLQDKKVTNSSDTDGNNRKTSKKNQYGHNKMTKKTYNKSKAGRYNKGGYKNYKSLINQAIKVPIIQVASKLGLPITQQKTTKCINPTHFDKGSSMSFNEEKNIYECFFCGTSGTTIDMVKSILRVTRNKAAEWILDKMENTEEYKKFIPEDRKKTIITGSNIDSKSPTSTYKEKPVKEHPRVIKKPHHKSDEVKNKLYEVRNKLIKSGEMQKMYRKVTNSLTPLSKIMIGIGFIKDKQISTDSTDKLGIGVLLNVDEIAKDFKKKYSMDQLYAAGLFRKPEDSNLQEADFTFKEHTVIFPYISGRMIVYLQGRRLDNKEPLYRTSTKGQPFIYNYNVLRQINEKQPLIICTDIVEAVSLIDKGFNVINVVNAHRFKSDWTKNIPSKKIILASDESEIQKRIGSIFLKNGINIRISNYDKISNTSKKKLESVGELYKQNKKSAKDDLPFWKNSK